MEVVTERVGRVLKVVLRFCDSVSQTPRTTSLSFAYSVSFFLPYQVCLVQSWNRMVIECTTQLAVSMLTLSLGLLRNVEDRFSPSLDYLSGRPRFGCVQNRGMCIVM